MAKGINEVEPDDVETLNLEPEFCHDSNAKEYLRIAVLPEDAIGADGTCSVQIVQFDKDWGCHALQACLSMAEIDIAIGALQEAGRRMEALNKGAQNG